MSMGLYLNISEIGGGLLLGYGKIVAIFSSVSQKRGWAFNQAWDFTQHSPVLILL